MVRDESRTGISAGNVLSGRYRLDSQIGRGGMGVVYRATDLELMREVAVKVISESSSADSRQRLIREARAAAALNHPHIISVYDVGEANGTLAAWPSDVRMPLLVKIQDHSESHG